MKTLALLVLLAGAVWPRSGFAPEDWYGLREASDPRIRADGSWIVYVESRFDRAGGSYGALVTVSADGKDRHERTRGPARDWSPRWSPDGKRIAWLSAGEGGATIRAGAWDGSDDQAVTGPGEEPAAFAWSPDGNAIAYLARVAATPPKWVPPDLLPLLRLGEPRTSLYWISAGGGIRHELPDVPPGCSGEPAWMPDGRALVAACAGGIFRFPLSGAAPVRLAGEAGRYGSVVVSPDGSRIACLFTPRRPQSYTIRKLCVMNADGSRNRILGGALDRDVSAPQWSSESRTVYFLAEDRGATHAYAAHNDGSVRQVTRAPERLRGFSLADNGRAASVRWRAAEAGDVVSYTVDVESDPVIAAAPDRDLLAARDLGAAEPFEFASDGHTIQAWLVRPVPFDPGRKYPLVVDAADDPRRMYGVEFDPRAQILAAAGYTVLHVNPRGTPGYGEEFGNLLRTRYPGDDFDDLMRGVDAALARGSIDPGRVYIAGGLLAAWAVGHTSRFHGAIAQHPVVDWAADVALRPDGPRRAAEWMGAMPWQDPEQYVQHSPLYFAGNFHTPVLIVANPGDAESEELYFALRAQNVEASMVHLPDSPAARVLEIRAMLAWMGR